MLIEIDDLLDSSDVATLLGLSQRNSVLTYAARYPDFPLPVVDRGRIKLWARHDILTWLGRGQAAEPDSRTRTAILVAARTLFAERPASEVTIRDIAAAAGVQHATLYRYFTSKEQLRIEVVDDAVATIRAELPPTASLHELVVATMRRGVGHPDAIRVMGYALLAGDHHFPALPVMSDVVQRMRQEPPSAPGPLAPHEAVAVLGALVLGWVTFSPRLRAATGTQTTELPADEQLAATVLALAGYSG